MTQTHCQHNKGLHQSWVIGMMRLLQAWDMQQLYIMYKIKHQLN